MDQYMNDCDASNHKKSIMHEIHYYHVQSISL
jgi:hypothetical protein